jgi:hypothetical protein
MESQQTYRKKVDRTTEDRKTGSRGSKVGLASDLGWMLMAVIHPVGRRVFGRGRVAAQEKCVLEEIPAK